MKKIFCIIIAAVLILSGCERTEENDGITVVTTVFPAYDFVRSIAGDEVNIKLLIKPGGDVHSYEPSPADIMAVNECDLFIYTGGKNDSWVETVLESAEDVRVLKMTECVELIEEIHHHESGEHAEPDEHVWTSPYNAIKICNAICGELCEADPENKELYKANNRDYTRELDELDREIWDVVESAEKNTLVFADRFAVRYFTERYGLEVMSAFPGCSGETDADPKTVSELIEKVKTESISVVFYAELSNTAMAETVKDATGAKMRLFHSCHNLSAEDFEAGRTYLDIMKDNLFYLKEAVN